MRRFLLLFWLGVAACSAPPHLPRQDTPQRIVSLDYCADQYVLRFAPRDAILAVSPDATKDFSYMRDAAHGLRQVRPRAESILALQPDLVVRSYGGGPNAETYFAAAGIPVLQVGWVGNMQQIEQVTMEMATALGAKAEGEKTVAIYHKRLQAIAAASKGASLYLTPGGVTTGPGGLIDEMFQAAGYTNYIQEPGWRELPLEQIVQVPPEHVSYARFDSHVTPWSKARHPVASRLLETLPVDYIEGAWTSCGGWFLIEAIEALANAAPES